MLMVYIIVDKTGGIQEPPEGFYTNRYSSGLFDGKQGFLPVIDKPGIHGHVIFTKLGHC